MAYDEALAARVRLADSDAVADDDLLGDLVRDAVAHSRTLPPKSSPATGV